MLATEFDIGELEASEPRTPRQLSIWQRRKAGILIWVASEKERLLNELGGKCAKCGSKNKLQFHHLEPRTWVARSLNRWSRLAAYKRDIAAGVVDVLCKRCNQRAGKPPCRDFEPDAEPDF